MLKDSLLVFAFRQQVNAIALVRCGKIIVQCPRERAMGSAFSDPSFILADFIFAPVRNCKTRAGFRMGDS